MVNLISPRQRFVLIGASNATIAFPTIVELALRKANQPLEILAATALGRSFGKNSKIFFRKLPSILDCPMWGDLETHPALPTRALITDIGNDILYGEPVDRIAEWIATCVERLCRRGAKVALTQLPLASLSKLGPRRFRFFRQLFFPRCRLALEEAIGRARELDARVLEIAKAHKIKAICPMAEWFGVDPIHVLKRHRTTAWNEYLNPLFGNQISTPEKMNTMMQAAYLIPLAPSERRLVGVLQRRKQPAGTLRDGTTLSLY